MKSPLPKTDWEAMRSRQTTTPEALRAQRPRHPITPFETHLQAAEREMQSIDMNAFVGSDEQQPLSAGNRWAILRQRAVLLAQHPSKQPAAMPAAGKLAKSALRFARPDDRRPIPGSGTTAGWIPLRIRRAGA
ncbi:hypothetical protein [Nevskia ramosa]|uniref:hypothetical protein n=1 Tax=Nevskia ramosa TaxID=64002 RepID=UPI003D0DF7BC